MFKEVSIRKIVRGYIVNFAQWSNVELPPIELFVTDEDMKKHGNLVSGLMTFEEAREASSRAQEPVETKQPAKKVKKESDDEQL